MANIEFKKKITKNFIEVVKYLKISGQVKSKTEVGEFIGQPLQVISKLLSGDRIITLEQMQLLIKNTNVSSYWFLTGVGSMIDDDDHGLNDPSVSYQKTEESTVKTLGVVLPLISSLEEKIKSMEHNIIRILEQLETIDAEFNKKK